MKKIMLIAAAAGLSLVAAAPPSHWRNSADTQVTGNGYPPCSRTVVDRCIQLYERGVATAANLALNERLGPNRPGVGLAAILPAPAPYAEPEPYRDEEAYAFAEPAEAPYSDEWADEEEYAAWNAEEDEAGYGEDVSGM